MEAPLWKPSLERIAGARVSAFREFLATRGELAAASYSDLHRWSVEAPEAFWSALWDFAGVLGEPGEAVLLDGERFPGARWFPGARLNFAENLLRHRGPQAAIVALLENGERRVLSRDELYREVAALAAALRRAGVGPGDRVAGFLPNVPEALIAMLAAASLGALWTSCSPDFGVGGVLDRFGQLRPKVLFVADGYYYDGKTIDCLPRVAKIAAAIDGIEQLVVVPVLGSADPAAVVPGALRWMDFCEATADAIAFERLPFDHPLYALYSSGTTGVPKCILHGAGGTLLQHLKEHQLHTDLRDGDVFFYFTTCGWMMWNWLASGLASGATLVLYDGSPFADEGRALLDAIDRESITVFGTSAKYIAALEKAGHRPRESHDLSSLRTILSTGSPLSPEHYDYVYRDFKAEVCLASISGGTDIVSCFVGGSPVLPVYRGEIQAPGLGMAVAVWNDDGEPVQGEKGELVCTRPFPSCPLGFWNDPDGSRFRAAYFDRWPGVWAHGDYAEVTAHGGFIIHGRSDAVLNPGGVRIGTAEIYRQVERVEEVLDSVVIGQRQGDDVRVVLFLVLREGVALDEALGARIRHVIRDNATPRHVPAKILAVPDIPRTISGKVAELAVRSAVHGEPVKNTDALANPESLAAFRDRPELAD
ncbi:acetoacetate--CoA ligase [Pseudohaliea rubra]|uniref:Acetoacetyl-CoA synthetase n=1 Tax=Pseudohaliea rubra DSM 19751 TaxID=1265313 RepID=A0A095VS69_9GAMM|nr:acetoacetate--CoA ligase [Pseudohaliea rubra]KGE03938.1 Acetoacetyl-CoA synthetase [Pseudohaliea rubra DSM 19751]